MKEPRSLLDVAPVLPVIGAHHSRDVALSVPVARAIARSGLTMIQVAMNTPFADQALERLVAQAPEIIVGAGAITEPDQADRARSAGAEFLVADSGDAELRTAMTDTELPHLPAAATVLQARELVDAGYTDVVLHPARGARHLRALATFVPEARLCLSGGIGAATFAAYLPAPNVGCVSADWLVPADAVRRRDWDRIRRLAQATLTVATRATTAPVGLAGAW